MDEECLVADVEGGGVGGNSLAHNDGPGVDEALLELRFTNLRFTIYFAVVHVENFVVVGGGGEDLVEM